MKVELKIDGEKMKVIKDGSWIETSSGSLIKKATIAFENKRKLPKTWEEYCHITGCKFYSMSETESEGNSYVINTVDISNISDIKEKHNKYTALRKLELLRDYYNDGWKSEEKEERYVIYKGNILSVFISYHSSFLMFKTEKMANKYFKNFKDLIKEAKDLI